MRQWRHSCDTVRSRPRSRQRLVLAPLQSNRSSERPAMCAWRLLSRGVFVPSPFFFGSTIDDAMSAAFACAARLFAPTQVNFPDIFLK